MARGRHDDGKGYIRGAKGIDGKGSPLAKASGNLPHMGSWSAQAATADKVCHGSKLHKEDVKGSYTNQGIGKGNKSFGKDPAGPLFKPTPDPIYRGH